MERVRPILMEDELYKATINGDARVLSEVYDDSYFTDQTTPENNNILHIAADYDQSEFIQEALSRFSELIRSKNSNGDTPLHVAARKGNKKSLDLLISYQACATEEESKAEGNWPWMVRNLQGDTPLHLALSNNRLNVAMDLLKVGSMAVLSLVNDSLETPLHILLRYCGGSNMTTADTLLDEGLLNLQGVYKVRGVGTNIRRSSPSIKHMLTEFLKYKPAACMLDTEGLTPLLIAAQLGCLLEVQLIVKHCPQSAEVCDNTGRTVLHLLKNLKIDNYSRDMEAEIGVEFPSTTYKVLKELLNIPEIYSLKDRRDLFGNTPAHVAVENREFVLVRVLFECFADFSIKNKDGLSALDLIKSIPDFPNKMEEVTLKETIWIKQMDIELLESTIKGNVTLFERRGRDRDVESGEVKYDDNYFLSRTTEGLSILHLAVKHGHIQFIEEAITHFPSLVLTADSSGETPLHIAAKLKNNQLVATTLLRLTKDCVHKFREEAGPEFLEAFPWRQKNSKGNTALHEALRSSNYQMAEDLMNIDSKLSSFENRAGETPLHILARYGTYTTLDKLNDLVKQLMGRNCTTAYTRDTHGFTPLLRAAYCGRIRVVSHIVFNCNSSVHYRDPNGRTFLHHLRLATTAEVDATIDDMSFVYKSILQCRGVDGLRDVQDNHGNTPLHLALKDKNFDVAKFLLQSCVESEVKQEMNIIDNEGHSIANLVALLADDIPDVKELKELALLAQRELKVTALGKRMMEKEVYSAAVNGDTNLFTNLQSGGDSEFLSQAPDGSNILHIAIQHRREAFVEEVLKSYPNLIFERNFNGDTPLHIAAKFYKADFKKLDFEKLLGYFNNHCTKVWQEGNRGVIIQPWRVKNSKGNTPLHEVLQTTNFDAAKSLLNFAPEVTPYVNNAGETPLHVFARRGVYSRFEENIDILDLLLTKNSSAVYMRDSEGLTPLLRAAKTGRLRVAHTILNHSPQSIQLRDLSGRSFLHLLRFTGPEYDESADDKLGFEPVVGKPLFKIPEIDVLRTAEDFDGNTPLHSAIKDGNSIGAKLLTKRFIETDEYETFTQLLVRNNEDQSILDLLASHDNAPNEVLSLLLKKAGVNVGWVRSSYGVCRTQIKEMANTLSVVAGLLATLTFAAAFQIPGGYDGGDGTPVLLKKLAFQVFMISDTCAMCGSMVVLFSLLWVMFTGKTSDSFLLLDLSISILLLSFDATLLAFMTGVYVAISHKTLWLAIFVCALCSTVIVLMRKHFILHITRFLRLVLNLFFVFKAVSLQDLRRITDSLKHRSEE